MLVAATRFVGMTDSWRSGITCRRAMPVSPRRRKELLLVFLEQLIPVCLDLAASRGKTYVQKLVEGTTRFVWSGMIVS